MKGRQIATLGRPLGASLALLGLLLAGAAAVGAAWADLSAAGEERDAKAELLARGPTADRRARPAAAADPFLAGDSPTLAAGRLDADLRALAVGAGLAVVSSRSTVEAAAPGAAKDEPGTRLEEQAVVEGQNEALQALLLRLEGGDPVVLVDALAVEPAEAAEGAAGDPAAPRLRASLTLSAYWRPRPGTSP